MVSPQILPLLPHLSHFLKRAKNFLGMHPKCAPDQTIKLNPAPQLVLYPSTRAPCLSDFWGRLSWPRLPLVIWENPFGSCLSSLTCLIWQRLSQNRLLSKAFSPQQAPTIEICTIAGLKSLPWGEKGARISAGCHLLEELGEGGHFKLYNWNLSRGDREGEKHSKTLERGLKSKLEQLAV